MFDESRLFCRYSDNVNGRRRNVIGGLLLTLMIATISSAGAAEAERSPFQLIEVSSEFGAGTRGSSLGPDGFRTACITRKYPWCKRLYADHKRINANPVDLFDTPHRFAKYIEPIVEVNQRVMSGVLATLGSARIPLIVHGDHSNSVGNFAAVTRVLGRQDMCLIYMDAHGDINSPYVTSTDSGNVHGMPVLAALKLKHADEFRRNKISEAERRGWEALQKLVTRPLKKNKLVLVGQRDLDDPERDLISREKIEWVKVEQARVNPTKVAQDIIARLKAQGCRGRSTVVSVDIDVLDARLVPGTGTPSEGGFELAELQAMLRVFASSRMLIALEVSEISPPLDKKNITSEAGVDLINTVMSAINLNK